MGFANLIRNLTYITKLKIKLIKNSYLKKLSGNIILLSYLKNENEFAIMQLGENTWFQRYKFPTVLSLLKC